MNFSTRFLATGLCFVVVSALTSVFWWRSINVGRVQRGADLAMAQGCLGCHGGPRVSLLLPRPFTDLDDVDPVTTREWILDGMPEGVRQDVEARGALEAAAIRMPAWRGRLSHAQVDDLVAYLRALASADVPEDPAARTGHAVAERFGCFGCHGPGGRGAARNPGSLKGYIPPWDGRDFTELVADEGELRSGFSVGVRNDSRRTRWPAFFWTAKRFECRRSAARSRRKNCGRSRPTLVGCGRPCQVPEGAHATRQPEGATFRPAWAANQTGPPRSAAID